MVKVTKIVTSGGCIQSLICLNFNVPVRSVTQKSQQVFVTPSVTDYKVPQSFISKTAHALYSNAVSDSVCVPDEVINKKFIISKMIQEATLTNSPLAAIKPPMCVIITLCSERREALSIPKRFLSQWCACDPTLVPTLCPVWVYGKNGSQIFQ